MLKALYGRLYNDYLRPDRFSDYLDLLRLAKRSSYRMVSLGEFRRLRKEGASFTTGNDRILILRHDIDTAPHVAPRFALAEASVGARASYFFRLCTVNAPIMRALDEAGHEVGYHYEDLATVAKEKGVNRAEQVDGILADARERFVANLTMLRERTGLPLRVAASHGDFANRALRTSNTKLLEDRSLRERAGIDLEAYDPEVEDCLAFRTRDLPYPRDWHAGDPLAAIRSGVGPILILTHPRQWGRQSLCNGREDLTRIYEGALFRFGIPQGWRRTGKAPYAPYQNANRRT